MHRQFMANNLPIEDNLVSISKAAEILDVSIDTLRRWDKKGIINSQRVNGKDRYYSIEEIERVKLSKPLTISQAAQELKVSQSSLRRLDKKGLIKPEKTKNGERLYSKKALEDFLHSEYFINKKEVEEKILEPLEKEEEMSSKSSDREKTTHKVIGAMVHNTNEEVSRLKSSRNIIFLSVIFVSFSFALIIIFITLLFLLFPKNTASFFGLATVPSGKKIIAVSKSGKAVLGAMTGQSDNQVGGRVLSSVFKPFAGISLEVVKQISPTTYEEVIPSRIVKDTSNHAIFSLNQQDYIVPQYPMKLPEGYLKVEDKSVITNLNAQYVQGRIPGDEVGNLVIFGDDGTIPSLKVVENNLADGTIADSKLTQITALNKVAGSAIELRTGGGLVDDSGLSLLTTCSSNQILTWNSSAWVCSSSGTSGVSSLNSLTGALTIAGAGINSVGASGSTITITGTEADTLATVTGRGATTTTALTLGDVTLSSNKALIVGSYSSDPGSPTSGTIFYNSTSNKIKIVENGSIKILCNTTDAGCGTGGTGSNWDVIDGVITPKLTSTLDFLLGSQASTSAKFAVLNVLTGAPTATLSAGTAGGAYLSATGTLETTKKQTLTLDNKNTGNILIGTDATERNITIGGASTTGLSLTDDNWSISAAGAGALTTLDTGQGANELYDMDQNVLTTSAVTFATLDTGQGANELYDMDQNVLTSSSPTFAGLTLSGLNANGGPLITNGSGVLAQVTAWTTGTVLHGNTGAAPSFSAVSLTADVSGVLPIANGGTNKALTLAAGAVAYTDSDSFELTAAGTTNQCLLSAGTGAPTWGNCTFGGDTTNWWTQALGAVYPINSTLDLLIGGTTTASARFAVTGINSGSTPTVTLSAGTAGGAYLNATGTLSTTAKQTLTLGTTTTGDILLGS